MPTTASAYSARVVGPPDIPVSLHRDNPGTITLDSRRAPHIEANLRLTLSASVLALLDPRRSTPPRMVIDTGTGRTFDLGVRSVTPDYADGTLAVSLASDEAILSDYAPLDDYYFSASFQDEISLQDAVNEVLWEMHLPPLQPGGPDPDVTPKFRTVNMLRNPGVSGSALNWSPGGGCTIAYTPAGSSGFIRVVPSATSGAVFACDTTKWNLNCTPGRWYTFSLPVRAETNGGAGYLVLRFLDSNNDFIKDVQAFATTPINIETTTLVVSALAPANAAKVAPYFRFTSNRVYRLDNGLLYESSPGEWVVTYFSGGDAAGNGYVYEYEGASNDSPSIRTPVIERDPDLLIWDAGESALGFLNPLVQSVGCRLICDEKRRFWIRDDTYTAPGQQDYDAASVSTAEEELSRDSEEWCDGAVFRWTWADRNGLTQTRDDTFTLVPNPTKVIRRDFDGPYPGPGRAENFVRRSQGRGRVVTVTAQARWDEQAEQPATITIGGETLAGRIDRVQYDLANSQVTVSIRTGEA